jgi:hypothetical protein
MLKKKKYLMISLSCIILLTSKCTLIGFGVGSIIDDNKSDKHYTINEDLFEISPETEIKLITVTNDTIIGLYKKTTNQYSDDYIVEYNNKYKEIKKQFNIPEIYDILSISNPMGNIYKYTFLGFDYNKIYVRSPQSGKELFINLNSNVKIKSKDGQYLNQYYVNNGFEYRLIPIMSMIDIENKLGTHSVFFHNIYNIQTNSTNKTRYLTIIGLGIDLFLYFNIERKGDRLMFKWD